jgi:hypothetical protein
MDLAAKLQLKPGQPLEGVLVPPAVASALPELDSNDGSDHASALVVFVTDRSVLEAHRPTIVESVSKDRLTWVAYPKSGQLGTDLNRDSLAALLTPDGIQPVRQVAVDSVWSALRFRPT